MINSINLLVTVGLLNATNAYELAVDNVRIYQPEKGNYSSPARIYVKDGKIVEIDSISAQEKPASTRIDGKSHYATPGLTDLHVHLSASGSNYSNFQQVPVESHLNSNLYLGVTQVVDLFSSQQLLDEVKRLSAAKNTPDLFYAGMLFTNKGGHGTQFGSEALEISSDEDIPQLWAKHMQMKPFVTKAVIESFGGHGTTLTDSQLKALGDRSKAAGLPYFVHVSTLEDGKRAIRAGATALAHGISSEAIDDEFIQLMKANNVAYIPTLAVMLNHSGEKESQAVSRETQLLEVAPEKLKRCLFTNVPTPSKWLNDIWNKRHHAFDNIKKLHQAGVSIGTGSDAGNPYTLHGTGLHNEFLLLSEAGLSNQEIINASTTVSAEILEKTDEFGQIAVGLDANFLVTEHNPIEDIRHLSDIEHVINKGEVIKRSQLISRNSELPVRGLPCNKLASTSVPASKVIDDFSEKLNWQSISDSMMGGNSEASILLENQQLVVNSTLGHPASFGAWAGAQLSFSAPRDASKFKGIEIKYQSSSEPIGLSLYHENVKDWDHFSTTLTPSEKWQTIQIPFSQLKQFGFGNTVEWGADKLVGLNFVWRRFEKDNTKPSNFIKLANISFY